MRRPTALAALLLLAGAMTVGGSSALAAVDPGDVGVGPVEAVDGQPLISVPVNNRYRLAIRTATGDRLLPVGSRGVPFDVDVGPGADGAPVAVYSRCKREPSFLPGNFGVPAYRTGQGCRLYRYDFSTERERRLRVRTRGSAFLPALWRDRVVWAQTTRTSSNGGEPAPELMTAREGHTPRRLGGGSAPDRSSSDGLDSPGAGPLSIDLRGTRISFVWTLLSRQADCREESRVGRTYASELWTERTTGSERRRLASAGCPSDGSAARILDTQVTAGGSVTLRQSYADQGYLRTEFEQRNTAGVVVGNTALPVPTVTTNIQALTFGILSPATVAATSSDSSIHLVQYTVSTS